MKQELLQQLSQITREEKRILEGGALRQAEYAAGKRFVVDSNKMLQHGRLISVRPHTRFISFPPHSHNYVELIYMAAGKTKHVINNEKPLELKKGELLFLNQHVTHSIEKAEEQDIAVNFIVLPEFFDTSFSMIGEDNVLGKFLATSLRQTKAEMSYLHFAVADVLPVQNLVENMIWGILEEQPNNRRIGKISMGLLFLQLLNYTQRLELPENQQGGSVLVLEALREVEENYQNANLSALAVQHGVSLAYMSRLVKEATGASFKQLLQKKRLAKAEQLLRETQLPVQEIIHLVGYENTSYFYRIFAKKFNCLPTECRE